MTNRNPLWRLLCLLLAAGDVLALLVANALATDLRYGVESPLPGGPHPALNLALVPFSLALLWLRHLYDEEYLLGGTREYALVVSACTYSTLAAVALSYFAGRSPIVSRAWLAFHWSLACGLICLWRFGVRRLVYRLRARGAFITRLIVAGASDHGVAVAEQLDAPARHGTAVVGFVDDYLPLGALVATTRSAAPHQLRVLGDPAALHHLAREHDVGEVVVIPQALSWESLETIVGETALSDVPFRVRLAPALYDVLATGVRPTPRGHVPLLALEKVGITGLDWLLKAALDRGIAAALLLVLAPLLGVLLAAGGLRRCRPLIAPRRVLGLAGRPVTLYFFGPWLGRYRLLRGLPVFANVLRGEVSLVGPRPQLAAPDAPPTLGILLVVKPGLTGLWRLAPADAPQPDWYDDLWYVRNYTIWEDLRILYQTLWRLRRPSSAEPAGLGHWQPEEGEGELVDRERPEARAGAAI